MARDDETNRNLRLIVRSSFVVLLAVLASKVISYVYKIIVARSFGPEVYGLFSLALIILGVFGALAGLGLADGLLRYIAFYRGKKNSGKIRYLVGKSIKLMFGASIVAAIILFFISDFLANFIFNEPELSYYLKILAISLPFSILSGAFLSILRAFENIKAYSFLVNFTHNVLKLGFLLILLFVGLKRDAILLSYVLAYVGLAAASYYSCKKEMRDIYSSEFEELKIKEKKAITRSVMSYSWPLVFSSIVLGIFFWTDSLLLGYFIDAEAVGLYNAAIALVALFSISQDLFIQIFIPLIAKNISLKKDKLIKNLTRQVFKWIFILNVPLFIMLILFPGVLINFFFGEQYITSSISLQILAVGSLFSGFTGLFIGLINIKGNTKKILSLFLIFSVLNAVLDIMLIPSYGLEGAALATTITWILFSATLFFNIRKDYGFYPIKRELIKIFLVALVPTIILYLLSGIVRPELVNLIIVGATFFIVYLALLLVTGCFDKNDWSILDAMKKKVSSYKSKKS